MDHAESATRPAPESGHRSFLRQAGRLLPPIFIVLASLLVGIVHVPQHDTISPIDEYVYIDYFAKVLDQGVVRQGEEVGPYARQELGCRGLRILAPAPDDRCKAATLSEDYRFPMSGRTSADIYTPLYFGVTRIVAEPLLLVGAFESPTQAGRFVGVLWLAGAGVCLYFTLRRLRIPSWPASGVALLAVGSMPAYWYNTYLSTDAPTMLAGALLALLTVRFVQGVGSGWWVVAVAAVATLFKFQNVAAVGAVALFLLFTAIAAAVRSRSVRDFFVDAHTRIAVFAVLAAVLAQAAWMTIRAVLTLVPASEVSDETPFGVKTLVRLIFSFLGQTGTGVDDRSTSAGTLVASIAVWVVIAGVIALAAVSRPGTMAASFAYASLAMAIVIGPLLAIAIRLSAGYTFELPTRYGLSLFPLFLICAALLVRRRPASLWVLAALGVISYGASLTLIG